VLDRLTQACYTPACAAPGDNFRRYTYDPVGNIATEVRDTGTTTYTYDAYDQLTGSTGPGGSVTYSYDADGRQTAAGSRSFTWVQPGRLATTTLGNTTTTYTYDGDGVRLQASTGSQANKKTNYDWDPNARLPQLVAERDGNSSLLRRYRAGLHTVIMDTGSNPFYFHYDGLGSVVNLTSSTGVTQWTYAYLPYGGVRTETKNQSQAPANVLRFTGELLDPTGLYHLRARQYDPTLGRFLSTDPAQSQISDPYLSTYAYALDNPIVNSDPSGRWTVGACVGLNFNFFGIVSAEIVPVCVVASTNLQVGLISSAGGGGQVGASASAALLVQISNADYVQDLAGPFANLGGSTEYGGGVSGSVFAGYGRCNQLVEGVTFGPSLGAGAEGHLTVTGTNVWGTIGSNPSSCSAK
jgi:RHS repeat-associated protein